MNNYEKTIAMQKVINSVFVGKEEVVEQMLTAMIAGGHVLLEDVPGVGKTTLAALMARVMSCSFGRIQFTPDTLPGDIQGISIYNMKSGEFEFREGAVMNQVLLADEINRTSPKTQASLLEAMAEGQVTVDGVVHPLPRPFMVIATQNPIEFLGTYPLPEAQLDRFMMRLSIGYPAQEQEVEMARRFLEGKTPDTVTPVCTAAEMTEIQAEVRQVCVKEVLLTYIANIIRLTRSEERFTLGASPRAMLAMVRAAQAAAYLDGRDFCKPDDIKKMAPLVLAHRLTLAASARLRREEVGQVLKSIIVKAPIPV